MQNLDYNYVKNKYGGIAVMLLIATDSLMYKIDIGNVYEDFYKTKLLFDLSNYLRHSNNYDNLNNLAIGKMKDEKCGMPTNGFVGLKAEVYTFIPEDNHKYQKAKGMHKKFADDELKYEDYKKVLFNRSYMRHEMNRI